MQRHEQDNNRRIDRKRSKNAKAEDARRKHIRAQKYGNVR